MKFKLKPASAIQGKKSLAMFVQFISIYIYSTNFYLYVTKQIVIKIHADTYNTNNFCLLTALYAHEL